MNVIIVGRGYPTANSPLNGVFEYDQAKALADLGINVKYLAFDTRSFKHKRRFGTRRFKENHLEIIEVNCPIGKMPLHRIFNKFIYRQIMESIIAGIEGPIIIHSHFLSIAERMNFSEKKTIRYVHTEHHSSLNIQNYTPTLKERCIKIYKSFDLLFAVSEKFCENIHNNLQLPFQIMPNIIDTENFYYMKKTPRYEQGLRFVYVGRLDGNKSVLDLLKAFDLYATEYRDATLSIIGTGPQYDMLRAFTKTMHFGKQVKFHGQLKRELISEIFREKDVFISLSKKETFGVAFIEAMACGLPVISRYNGGSDEYIDKSNGVMVDYGIQSVVEAMSNMTRNFTIYNTKEISQNIVDKYSPIIIAKRLQKEYIKLLGEY